LQQAPQERAEETEAVAQMARQLVDGANQSEPNQSLLHITGKGLKEAAQALAGAIPTVLSIATQIVSVIVKVTGP